MPMSPDTTRKLFDNCVRRFATGNEFLAYVAKEVKTTHWVLAPKLTGTLTRRGIKCVVTRNHFLALRYDFGLPLFIAAVEVYIAECNGRGE